MFRRGALRLSVAASGCLIRRALTAVPAPKATFSTPYQCIATQRRFNSCDALKDAAEAELQEEQSLPDKPQPPAVPHGWTLEQKAGDSFFTMKKSYGDETLELYCEIPTMESEPEGQAKHYPFVLRVERKNSALEFTLTSVDAELVIDGVASFKDLALARDRSASGLLSKERKYQGPVMGELNGSIVEGFVTFLEERGVNDDFGAFVAQYAYFKEQNEYENWLKSIIDFSSK